MDLMTYKPKLDADGQVVAEAFSRCDAKAEVETPIVHRLRDNVVALTFGVVYIIGFYLVLIAPLR